MNQKSTVIYKRITVIKRALTETDQLNEIYEALKAEGIECTESIIEKDIRAIHRGDYPDMWLDNFLNVVYPEMFRSALKEINEIRIKLKEYTQAETNGSRNVITALNSQAKLELELINLMSKGPSIRMMRNLKVKADKLARALDEERTITKKLDII